jgi:hypothetical protein
VLLVVGAPCQPRLLAGQEHGRTIPLADEASVRICSDRPVDINALVDEMISNGFYAATKRKAEANGDVDDDVVTNGQAKSGSFTGRLCRQHGGFIEVDRQPGEFTEFRIVLPRASASLIKSGERM